MIRFTCPKCQTTLSAPTKAGGRKATCKHCGANLIVPQAAQIDDEAILEMLGQPENEIQNRPPISAISGTSSTPATEEPHVIANEPFNTQSQYQLSKIQCPKCRSQCAPDSVICVTCGWNLRKSQRTETEFEELSNLPAAQDEWTTNGDNSHEDRALRDRLEALKQSRNRDNRIGILVGIPGIIGICCFSYLSELPNQGELPSLVYLISAVCLALGLGFTMRARGHSLWWGVTAVFCCGVFLLGIFEDHIKTEIDQLAVKLGDKNSGSEVKVKHLTHFIRILACLLITSGSLVSVALLFQPLLKVANPQPIERRLLGMVILGLPMLFGGRALWRSAVRLATWRVGRI